MREVHCFYIQTYVLTYGQTTSVQIDKEICRAQKSLVINRDVKRNTKEWWGETERGRILRKINSFCEILNKMSQKGEGVDGPSPPPLCTPMPICIPSFQSYQKKWRHGQIRDKQQQQETVCRDRKCSLCCRPLQSGLFKPFCFQSPQKSNEFVCSIMT